MREKMRNSTARESGLKKDRRAISPAISTVILTCAIVVLLLVTVSFANSFLTERIAENEFEAMMQFMQTVGLQVDDVAWTIGRTQTTRYASQFGRLNFESTALNYTVYVDKGEGYVNLAENWTGILLFNMPISKYSVTNNYHERLFPNLDNSFLQKGTSAPVTHVYVIEKMPMSDGDFIRVVVAPSIRMLNSTISTGAETKNYFKFYLPYLRSGTHPHRSQSVTLTGNSVSVEKADNVNKIKIQVSFLKSSLGFSEEFFNFESLVEEIDVPDGSIVEFYVGEVSASLGLHV